MHKKEKGERAGDGEGGGIIVISSCKQARKQQIFRSGVDSHHGQAAVQEGTAHTNMKAECVLRHSSTQHHTKKYTPQVENFRFDF